MAQKFIKRRLKNGDDVDAAVLQSQLDDTSKELEMVKDDFVNANSLTDLELRNAREACQRLESRRLTIVQLMEIPSKLAEQGREARGLPGSDSATH